MAGLAIRLEGLKEFHDGLKEATKDGDGQKILIRANMRTWLGEKPLTRWSGRRQGRSKP
jgi:hypothetical protein